MARVKRRLARQAKKVVIPFSSATRANIVEDLRLNLSTLNDTSFLLELPEHFPTVNVSDHFIWNLEAIIRHWNMDNEASKSAIISLFLTEAFTQVGSDLLCIFPQVEESWEGGKYIFRGVLHYAIATEDQASQMFVVEVKAVWGSKISQWQLLAEAGCILKNRLAKGRKTPVMAVLTDGSHFQFFAIDERDLTVYASRVIFLDYRSMTDLSSYSELGEVARWLNWFLNVIISISPRSSPIEFSYQKKRSRLAELRRCFKLGC